MTLQKKLIPVFLLAISVFAFAEGTKTWQQSSYDEFSRGTSKGIAIRSLGRLELAPSFQAIHTSPATYIWTIASDKEGNIYVGTGSPARVYRITPDGKATVIFEPKELQVQSVTLDDNGIVYAATSPDGKVYKIERGTKLVVPPAEAEKKSDAATTAKPADPTAKTAVSSDQNPSIPVDPYYSSSVFFEPKTKYIWDLVFDAQGRLFVATGDHGEIFRVNKDGTSSTFFKSDEAHMRTLLVHPSGDLIAGSDGSGLIYRISPAGEGFVIYSAAKKEITSLAIDSDGNIYAAGVGEKRSSGAVSQPSFSQPPISPVPGVTIVQPSAPPPQMFFPGASQTGGSEVYMISPDGSPKRLWTSRDDLVYALTFDSRGRLLAGAGNKGRLVAISKNGEFTDLWKASANQITGFANAPARGLYISTANLGKVFLQGASSTDEGVLESEVFDARIFSKWGRAEVEGTGNFEVFTRSGNVDNPDRNWSPWKKVDLAKDSSIEAPAARFVQWKVVIPARSNATVESVKLNFHPKNVAPVVEDITVQAGARFNTAPVAPRGANETVMVGFANQPAPPIVVPQQNRVDSPLAAQRDRSSIAVRWSAHDDNDDALLYSVYYRGDSETRWKLLKEKITDKQYSWDSALLPDGGYVIRVVATDAPSHSPDEALGDSRESAHFEIDNTPPRIDSLTGKMEGGSLRIAFTASDTFSPIQRAEFSVDAGEWQYVEPVGQVSDSKLERYDFTSAVTQVASTNEPGKKKPAAKSEKSGAGDSGDDTPVIMEISNEHVVVVRVYDRFDNVGIGKIVVK